MNNESFSQTFNSWREGYDYLTRLMSRKSIPQGKWGRGVYLFGCMERGMLIKNHTFGMSLLLFTGVCLLGSAEYSDTNSQVSSTGNLHSHDSSQQYWLKFYFKIISVFRDK